MRGVAYAIGERELLMRLHEQGISLSALSRQTGIRRELLSRWWKRFREQGRAGLGAGADRLDLGYRSQQRASRFASARTEPSTPTSAAGFSPLRKEPPGR